MLTKDEARKLADKVTKLSSYPECQVTITSQEQAYTRFANNGITTASFSLRHNVAIAVTREGRTGATATNDLDDASLSAAVKKAEELASIAPPNPERLGAGGAQDFSAGERFRGEAGAGAGPEAGAAWKRENGAGVEEKKWGGGGEPGDDPGA